MFLYRTETVFRQQPVLEALADNVGEGFVERGGLALVNHVRRVLRNAVGQLVRDIVANEFTRAGSPGGGGGGGSGDRAGHVGPAAHR